MIHFAPLAFALLKLWLLAVLLLCAFLIPRLRRALKSAPEPTHHRLTAPVIYPPQGF